jgi:MFS family permease
MDKPMPRTLGARLLIGRRASFWIVATTFGLFLFAAAAPSPLYAVYAGLWQFSAGALTEVFAVYAIALLVALLFTGSSSDFVGRRPIILVALVIQLASIVLFLAASGIEWLFAARIAQGIATGIATGALGAALVDLQPPENPALASLVNSAGPILSLGIGALASAVLVQYAPDPLHLIYWVTLLGFIAALAAVAVMPEPGVRRSGVRWVPRISVERAVRREFVATLPSPASTSPSAPALRRSSPPRPTGYSVGLRSSFSRISARSRS